MPNAHVPTLAAPDPIGGAAPARLRLEALARALAASRLPQVGDADHLGADGLPGPVPPTGTTAVGLSPADDGEIEIHLQSLDGDPAVGLRGFVAPDRWQAVGLVGTATARRLPGADDPAGLPEAAWLGRRVAMAALVDRDGTNVQVLAPPDGEAVALGGDEPWVGRVPDALARCLGRPTAPPVGTTARLWTLLWLDVVLGAALAARPPCRLSATDAGDLHPGRALGDAGSDEAGPDGADDVVELTRRLAAGWSWDAVRRAVADDRLAVPGIDAADAAWFDAGSFQRAALEGFPDPHELLADLRASLPALTYHQVLTTAVHALELHDDRRRRDQQTA